MGPDDNDPDEREHAELVDMLARIVDRAGLDELDSMRAFWRLDDMPIERLREFAALVPDQIAELRERARLPVLVVQPDPVKHRGDR
jgi:hypothetical protein